MQKIYPEKLKKDDEIRIIAPSESLGIISQETRDIAKQRFDDLGLSLSFGKNVEETDFFHSSSVESRLEDLYKAFSDQNVKAIFTVIGGYNSNQLLRGMDWNLIRNNPKIFCGFSDITVLNNAIYKKTGLVSYQGPHYSTFGQKKYFDYTLDYFKKCLMFSDSFEIAPSEYWTDDAWYRDQDNRQLIPSEALVAINFGQSEGTILGGNLCTFNLLQGTEYFPDLSGSILFLEDDDLTGDCSLAEFDRNLQSLIHQPSFIGVRGIVIGRFQKASEVNIDGLTKVIKNKRELERMPVVYGLDFGHTDPRVTFPVGGEVSIKSSENIKIEILKH